MFVRCLIGQVATMNREKGGRHNQFLDKWQKSLDGCKQEVRAMIYRWFVRIAQKLERRMRFTSGCKNFQRSALVRHISQVDHKSSAKVLLQQKNFKAASDIASRVSDDSLVKQIRTAYWLSQEEMPPKKFNSLCELQVRNRKILLAIKLLEFYCVWRRKNTS